MCVMFNVMLHHNIRTPFSNPSSAYGAISCSDTPVSPLNLTCWLAMRLKRCAGFDHIPSLC